MSETCVGKSSNGPSVSEVRQAAGRHRVACHLTVGLRLAAAPTFSVMALLADLPNHGGSAEFLCLAADHSPLLSGMVPMYLLMSAFHLPPWLQLLFSQGGKRV